MLLDGCISFAKQALEKMKAKEFAAANELYIKAERIVLELVKVINPQLLDQKLYNDIIGLYLFCYRRLYWGNIKKDEVSVQESLKILLNLRDMWKEAIDKLKKEQSGDIQPKNDKPPTLDIKS
jgi:flagellar protein FliS